MKRRDFLRRAITGAAAVPVALVLGQGESKAVEEPEPETVPFTSTVVVNVRGNEISDAALRQVIIDSIDDARGRGMAV